MSRQFVPSVHSYGDLTPFDELVLFAAQDSDRKRRAWATRGGAALPNPSTIAEAREKAKKYEAKYKSCKKKCEAKGKKAYPEDDRTGISAILVVNCHSEYNKWQEWKKRLPPPSDKPESDESKLVPENESEDSGSSWPLVVFGVGGVVLILGVAYTMSR